MGNHVRHRNLNSVAHGHLRHNLIFVATFLWRTTHMAKKWYVVYQCRVPVVYGESDDCLKQVNGFNDNYYKGYKSKAAAESRYMKQNHPSACPSAIRASQQALSSDAATTALTAAPPMVGVRPCNLTTTAMAGDLHRLGHLPQLMVLLVHPRMFPPPR
ncbi:hypothetical protein QYE76_040315 [Lolium multiflorum]|uniref:Ribonuclease H1 N-terminal domain-containing protein n=1 Tax=Lolium multiflorum TaxID=4521 RepID=A0AAD8TCR0_LOLMU|nr:hypothetical protein QYE76_040315 [Lolium multiflorum]